MANRSLGVNPVQGARTLTTGGSSWLWAVFAVFLASFLLHALMSFMRKRAATATRGPNTMMSYLPYIFTIALFAGSLAYFAQAGGLGSNAIRTSSGSWRRYPSYQVFWPKYAYWAVSFPAIVLALGVLTRAGWSRILFGMGLALLWVFSYYLSSQTRTSYKWGFFAMGTAAWLALAAHTMSFLRARKNHGVDGHHNNGVTGTNTNTTTTTTTATPANGGAKTARGLILWTNFLWMLYPIAFGLSDGGNVIGVTRAFIFFGILDILLLPLIAAASLFHARKWGVPERHYNNEKYGHHNGLAGAPLGTTGAHHNGVHNGVHNGTTTAV